MDDCVSSFLTSAFCLLPFALCPKLSPALDAKPFSGLQSQMVMFADLRHAFRSLRRARWYSGTVIGVIALGMALATTVFAVFDGVLFKPLPYSKASELFSVTGGYQKGQRAGIS